MTILNSTHLRRLMDQMKYCAITDTGHVVLSSKECKYILEQLGVDAPFGIGSGSHPKDPTPWTCGAGPAHAVCGRVNSSEDEYCKGCGAYRSS